MSKVFKKSENKWIERVYKHLKELSKKYEQMKVVLDYIKRNKKTFKTVPYYKDFQKKRVKLEHEQKLKQAKKPNKDKKYGEYLTQEDVFNFKMENDSNSSLASPSENDEEIKMMDVRESMVDNKMREYELKKGKVTSTYIMKKEANDDGLLVRGDMTAEIVTVNALNFEASVVYKIIRHQLKSDSHPIRMIIKEFSKCFVKAYHSYVNKSTQDVDELYKKLEQANSVFLSQMEDRTKVLTMQKKKRHSEFRGDAQGADKINLPKYFLFNQVVGDVKLFIEEMKKVVIEFYTVVATEDELGEIEEELYECLTDLILSGNLQKIVFTFFKLESEDRKKKLIDKYKEYINIKPQNVGIDEKFALNE
jgi:hypothetical protein